MSGPKTKRLWSIRKSDRPLICSSKDGQIASGPAVQRTAISVAGSAADTEDDDEDITRPLPDRLITELTAHRTLALRDALAENPAITFQAVLHNFVLTTFYRFASSGSCLQIGLHTPTFPAQAPGLKESVSARAIDARHEGWKERLPRNEAELWDALTALDGTAQASLFAHCASFADQRPLRAGRPLQPGPGLRTRRPLAS